MDNDKKNSNNNLPYDDLFDSDIDNLFVPQEEPENTDEIEIDERTKFLTYASIVGVIIIVLLIVVYIWGARYYRSHFFPRTDINGIDVGGQTVNQAIQTIESNISRRQVAIVGENNQSGTISSSEINLSFDNDIGDLEKLLHEQDEYFWEIYSLTRQSKNLNTQYSYDKDKLKAAVNKLSIVSGPSVIAPENATISYNGTEFIIDPSVEGNQPDTKKLEKRVVQSLIDDEKEINLARLGLYNKPKITNDNQALKDELNEYNTAVKAAITLNFPGRKVVLDKNTFHTWLLTENDKVTVDDNSLNDYVAQLANEFNNNGKDVTLNATNGKSYTYNYKTGWELNQTEEALQLKRMILAGDVETVEPVWLSQGSKYLTGATISGDYIEVSLDAQTLWFYKNNTLVSYSTIVSGNLGSNQATSTGLFFLQSKETNVNLVVRQLDGKTANTQVRYWLPYNQNIGIESASWRTDFGEEIYKTQGTDGDIDVPSDMAQVLFDSADVGMPVVIY